MTESTMTTDFPAPSGPLPENTDTFSSGDGLEVFYRRYAAPKERARLVLAHGLGEHSGRYGHVVERLLERGLSVWAIDHRGHGRTQGPRGHIMAFGQYVEDLKTLVVLASNGAGLRPFLLGHSMGGLIALGLALKYPQTIRGLLVSSPLLGVTVEVPAFKKVLGRIMSRIWPGLTMRNELDPTKISHAPAVVAAYRGDPLVHDLVSARWFTEVMAAVDQIQARAADLNLPFLMQVAGDDHLVSATASQEFFHRVGSADKTLRVYPGLYHEIFNETRSERQTVLAELDQWLDDHCGESCI